MRSRADTALVAGFLALCLTGCGAKFAGERACDEGAIAWLDASGDSFSSLDGIELEPVATLHICAGEWPASADIWLLGGASIVGAGMDETVLNGDAGEAGHFDVSGSGTVRVTDLTVRGVSVAEQFGGGLGLGVSVLVIERVRLEGNAATGGGGLAVGTFATATVRDSEVVRNSGYIGGGGASLYGTGTLLISENTDWGSGDTDNTPDDVGILDDDGDLVQSYTFDGVASFTCDGDERTCE